MNNLTKIDDTVVNEKDLSVLIEDFKRFGAVHIWYSPEKKTNGYKCIINMATMSKGTVFNVVSDKHTTLIEAVIVCRTRMFKALESIK